MKTLVVFTDFTIKAENTAFYALSLARQIKADILLCHVLPATNRLGEANEKDYLDAIYDIAELAGRVKKRLSNSTLKEQFIPSVEYYIKTGTMSAVLNQIAAERGVTMAVISTHKRNKLTSLLIGSSTSELIENATCPVLVVPYETQFCDIATMVFATDLDSRGMTALNSLSNLAASTNSEILIAHITSKKIIDGAKNASWPDFFDEVSAHISYPKKRYKLINDRKVISGLKKLPQKTEAGLVAMVHRKRNCFERFFGTSLSLFAAGYLAKPILIFPLQAVNSNFSN